MSTYQLERFVLGSEPPIGRYHQACIEIRRRTIQLRAKSDYVKGMKANSGAMNDRDVIEIEMKIIEMEGLHEELVILRQLAEKYKPLTDGRTHEEIQPEYWDERKSYDLAIALITGDMPSTLIRDIMDLHEDSMARRFLMEVIGKSCESAGPDITPEYRAKLLLHEAHRYIEEYHCRDEKSVDRPKLLPR